MSNRTGEVWTPEEFVQVLDAFLDGKGLGDIAELVGREIASIEDVINDFPINRRNCIYKLTTASRMDRTGRRWKTREREYLIRLKDTSRDSKTLSLEEIATVLGREPEDVDKEIKRTVIQRPSNKGLFDVSQVGNS